MRITEQTDSKKFNCDYCHDTGELTKAGYLDCYHCGEAERRAVEQARAGVTHRQQLAMAERNKRDAKVAEEAAKQLRESETYRMQIAAICCAARGSTTEGIQSAYVTPALGDVAELYEKYAQLHKDIHRLAELDSNLRKFREGSALWFENLGQSAKILAKYKDDVVIQRDQIKPLDPEGLKGDQPIDPDKEACIEIRQEAKQSACTCNAPPRDARFGVHGLECDLPGRSVWSGDGEGDIKQVKMVDNYGGPEKRRRTEDRPKIETGIFVAKVVSIDLNAIARAFDDYGTGRDHNSIAYYALELNAGNLKCRINLATLMGMLHGKEITLR